MAFMLSLWDLGLWLAASSIIMLVTSEVLSPHYGRINLLMEVKKMRKVAIGLGIAFLVVIAPKILTIIFSGSS